MFYGRMIGHANNAKVAHTTMNLIMKSPVSPAGPVDKPMVHFFCFQQNRKQNIVKIVKPFTAHVLMCHRYVV